MRACLASLLFTLASLTAVTASGAPGGAKAAVRTVVAKASADVPSSRGAEGGGEAALSFARAGQAYRDSNGDEWLGKVGKGDAQELDRFGNDHAAAAIYRLAEPTFGTAIPDVRVAKIDGKPVLLTKKVPLGEGNLGDDQLKRFGSGFIIDAWLANWDVGAAWQIAMDPTGKPLRSVGSGAGLFRTKGEAKGQAFADQVTELKTMRDPLRATSFGYRKVTDRDVKEQLAKFAAWYPSHRADIELAIDGTTMSPAAATVLKAKLAARAQWLLKQARK